VIVLPLRCTKKACSYAGAAHPAHRELGRPLAAAGDLKSGPAPEPLKDRGRFEGTRPNEKGNPPTNGRPRYFGFVLSVFVLCLQLVVPSLHSSLQLGSGTNGDLARLLGEHALCFGLTPGSSTGKPATPPPPAQNHRDDFASCCFCHSNAGQPVSGVASGVAVLFDIAIIAFRATTYPGVVPVHTPGTFSARAPPVSE